MLVAVQHQTTKMKLSLSPFVLHNKLYSIMVVGRYLCVFCQMTAGGIDFGWGGCYLFVPIELYITIIAPEFSLQDSSSGIMIALVLKPA